MHCDSVRGPRSITGGRRIGRQESDFSRPCFGAERALHPEVAGFWLAPEAVRCNSDSPIFVCGGFDLVVSTSFDLRACSLPFCLEPS